MRAYVINPEDKTITEVDIAWKQGQSYGRLNDEIYKYGKFDCFDVRIINRYGDCVYVDDEGALKPNNAVFELAGNQFFGRGVVLGSTPSADTRSPRLAVEWLQGEVKFPGIRTTGKLGPSKTEVIDHPTFGPTTTFSFGKPILKKD